MIRGKYAKTIEAGKLKRAIEQYLKATDIKKSYFNTESKRFQLYHVVTFQLMNSTSHPAFLKAGCKRLVPYDSEFVSYPEGIQDTHISTFLKGLLSS